MTRLLLLLLCTGEAQAYDALIGATESETEALHGPFLPENQDILSETATEATDAVVPVATTEASNAAVEASETVETSEVTETTTATEEFQGTPIPWDEPIAETATAAAPSSNPLSLLLLPLGLGLLGGTLLLRNKLLGKTSTSGTDTMTVVARKALGNHSALIVLDVIDLEGQTRRLLVGTGQGSPALVADIGGAFGTFDNMSASVATEDTGFDFSSSRQTTATPRSAPVLNDPRTGDGYPELVPEQRDAAQTLVDRMLSEREGYGKAILDAQVRVTA